MTSNTADHGTPILTYEGHRIRRRGDLLNLSDLWQAAEQPGKRPPDDWLVLMSPPYGRHASAGTTVVDLSPPWTAATRVRRASARTAPAPPAGRSTWGPWPLALSYGRYLSPALHAWCRDNVVPAADGSEDVEAFPTPAKPEPGIAAEFRQLNARLDTLERHLADLMFLQLSAQEIIFGKRRAFSPGGRETILSVVREAPYLGRCPCCGTRPVLDAAGQPLPGAEVDHVFHRGLNRPEHGWLICQPCHRDLTNNGHLVRFGRMTAFRRFQDRVLAKHPKAAARAWDVPS